VVEGAVMTLFDLSGKRATQIPYEKDFTLFRTRLSPDEQAAVDAWIDERIAGDEIHTAGWMPGSNWIGTPLEPIYSKSARRDTDLAARAFGLFVYVRFMEHPEEWISGRFELHGRNIGSRTYFKKRA
jgi:hypothetical protein